jgi:uncharacterized membrane protein
MSVRRGLAVIAAIAIVAVFALSAVASAQTTDYPFSNNTVTAQSIDPGVQTAGVSTTRVQVEGASTLPFTGADVSGMVAVAVILIAFGVVAVRLSHRRAARSLSE